MEKVKTYLSNRENLKLLGGILVGLVFGLVFILIFNPFNIKRLYQKPKAWIISQGLNATLTKQQLLLKSAKNGAVSLDDIAKVATASTKIKAEAVKIGNDYVLSTGADGQVISSIEKGTYKIGLIPIPGVDFTGVPKQINIQGDYQLKIGLVKGSGKITTVDSIQSEASESSKLTITLNRPWAGITIKLTKLK